MATLHFRTGRPQDSSDLAILFDAAGRRICAWYWGTMAAPRQSWHQVGRDRIVNQPDVTSHHSKWLVAERQGQTVGALMGFSLPDPYDRLDLADIEPTFHPMIEMEMTATGCWLLQAIALFPEHRGKGFGPAMIDKACAVARSAGHTRIVPQVESPNTGANALYRNCGFVEWDGGPMCRFRGPMTAATGY